MRLFNKTADRLKQNVVSSDPRDELWSSVKDMVDIGLEARRPYEQRWIISMAFLSGRQYTRFNQSAHTLTQLKRPTKKIWNVDNQLLPRWRRQIADLIRTPPTMSVVPNSNDDDDIKAAHTGDKVLKAFWLTNKMRSKMRQLGGWIYSCGNAFVDDRWNSKLGPLVKNPETGVLEYPGDVDCGIWSPFEILVPFVNMGETDLHDFPWMIKQKRRTLDWISNNYERGIEVAGESPDSNVMGIGSLLGNESNSLSSKIESATLYDVYIQPSYQHPNGLFVTAANGIILQQAEYPLNYYHLEQFKDIDIPGVFWGQATLENAIGLQRTWNQTISGIDEFNRVMGKGKWLVPRTCNMEVSPDDVHGQKILYTPAMGFKPEHLTLKGLPGSYNDLLSITKVSIEDLFSQHEVTRGTNKSDIRSGDMVALLREQDAQGNIPSHSIFEESLERVMKRVLGRIAKEYKIERMLKIMGDEGEFSVFSFKGADLNNNTDVIVKSESSLPDSRISREARVLNKYEKGVYGDPTREEVRREVLRMLGEAAPDDIFATTRLDEKLAKRENELMKQGAQVVPNPYDNHQIHYEVLNRYRKSIEHQKMRYEQPEVFTEIDGLIGQHSGMHEKAIAEAREAMVKEQIAIGGGNKNG